MIEGRTCPHGSNVEGLPRLAIVFAMTGCMAAQPAPLISRYIHTVYGIDRGMPETIIHTITQSREGFLWMTDGNQHLIRFDGQSFYEVPAPFANSLALAPNGDLWVVRCKPPVLTRIGAADLNRFGDLPSTPYRMAAPPQAVLRFIQFGRDGALWVAASTGLYRFENGRFVPVIPDVGVTRIEESSNGHLQIVTDKDYFEWDGARLIAHPEIARELGVKTGEIFHVFEDRRGVTWYCTASGVARRRGNRIERLEPWGAGHGAYRVYEDPSGAMWFARADGVYRAAENALELADKETNARWLFTDRDGQLWIATNGNGIIRLHDPHSRHFTTADGLPNNTIMSVVVRADGSIWAGANCGGISRFDGKHFVTYAEKDGLRNSCVFAMAEDTAHNLWIGSYGGGAFRFRDGVFTQFSTAQGVASDIVTAVFAAPDGSVWLATAGGPVRIRNTEVRNYTVDGGRQRVMNFYQDRAGVLWAGTPSGLARLEGDGFVTAISTLPSGAFPIGEDESGRLYVTYTSNRGLYRLEKNKLVSVLMAFAANDVLTAGSGAEWFIGPTTFGVAPGALSIHRARDEPLDYRVLDETDGVPSGGSTDSFSSSAIDGEGRLWMGTLGGLVALDLPRMPRSDAKPPIYLKEVTHGRIREAPGRELVFPPGTSHIDLRFDAIELVAPEKIHLQYRMDGVDPEWLDADPPGLATYTFIPPGSHAFHIRANNRDGAWDRTGVVFRVTQQPYLHETTVFKVSLVCAVGLMLLAGYRFRIRQVAAQMNARFDERLNERTRIARELHDTLLQTIQGSKMMADQTLDEDADVPHMRKAVVRLSGWLSQAVEEARAALSALRASTLEGNDLVEALRRALIECQVQHPIEFDLTVEGTSRGMHPIVRDEIYRIAYEAIRNACVHSGGKLVSVQLVYRQNLILRVRDDGHGMDPATAEMGKESHFGIVGMYERAVRIGAKLTLASSAATGTEVELVVPGHIVFEHPTFSFRRWISHIRHRP